ncbi:MAG: NAD(+)/NADH kinase [Deltaproteobacteria bacterium]|nr:NAD(+)/NADH kinase [Deltaproteobacteria bacterium]
MVTIGLVARHVSEEISQIAADLMRFASANGCEVLVEKPGGECFGGGATAVSIEDLVRRADPIVVLGGDGSMLRVARQVSGTCPVLIGVNFGTLGFLTEIAPCELISCLQECLKGRQRLVKRSLLYTQIVREGAVILRSQALNDVVVQKGLHGRLVDYDVYVDDEPTMRVRGDGVIFSTPTGSTAYALSAGGSIVHPDISALLVTPICAHSLTNRPLILPLDVKIRVRTHQHEGEVVAIIDGQESLLLQPGDEVFITKAEHCVALVRSPSKSYFEVLRSKLHWGVVNKSD